MFLLNDSLDLSINRQESNAIFDHPTCNGAALGSLHDNEHEPNEKGKHNTHLTLNFHGQYNFYKFDALVYSKSCDNDHYVHPKKIFTVSSDQQVTCTCDQDMIVWSSPQFGRHNTTNQNTYITGHEVACTQIWSFPEDWVSINVVSVMLKAYTILHRESATFCNDNNC